MPDKELIGWVAQPENLDRVVAYAIAAIAMLDKILIVAMKTIRGIIDEFNSLFRNQGAK